MLPGKEPKGRFLLSWLKYVILFAMRNFKKGGSHKGEAWKIKQRERERKRVRERKQLKPLHMNWTKLAENPETNTFPTGAQKG